jgi:transposase-like protein
MLEPLKSKRRTRVNWTAQERAEWLELFAKSGRSIAEFCSENELPKSTLANWLRREGEAAQPNGSELVELPRAVVTSVVAEEPRITSGNGVTLQFPGGAWLRIDTGTDPAWLGQWLPGLLTAGHA